MQTLIDLLNKQTISTPNSVLYRFLNDDQEISTLTSAELRRNALAFAAQLSRYAQPNDLALIACTNSLHFINAFFGCLYAGIIAVPSAPAKFSDRTSRFINLIQDCRPQVIITETMNTDLVATLCASINHSSAKIISANNIPLFSDMKELKPVIAEDIAFIQYTSGTTRNPRGAMIRHSNVIKNLEQLQQVFQYDKNTIGLTWLPPYHDMGLTGGILHGLYAGSPLNLMSATAFARDPLSWLKAISDWKVTATGGPNFAYEACVRAIEKKSIHLDLSHWNTAAIGAEPPSNETIERFSSAFTPHGFSVDAFRTTYGSSEATLFISTQYKHDRINTIFLNNTAMRKHEVILQTSAEANSIKLVSSGKPAPDISVMIVDPITRHPCEPYKIGEIWVKGSNTAKEFFGDHVLRSNRYLNARTANNSDGPYLRTGDLGFLHQDELYVTGRYADLIPLKQGFLYPQWLEKISSESHSDLVSTGCAAFPVDYEEETYVIVAQEVKLGSHRNIDVLEIESEIHQRIQSNFNIDKLKVLLIKPHQLPRTSSGKIQRYQCHSNYIKNKMLDIVLMDTHKRMEV